MGSLHKHHIHCDFMQQSRAEQSRTVDSKASIQVTMILFLWSCCTSTFKTYHFVFLIIQTEMYTYIHPYVVNFCLSVCLSLCLFFFIKFRDDTWCCCGPLIDFSIEIHGSDDNCFLTELSFATQGTVNDTVFIAVGDICFSL